MSEEVPRTSHSSTTSGEQRSATARSSGKSRSLELLPNSVQRALSQGVRPDDKVLHVSEAHLHLQGISSPQLESAPAPDLSGRLGSAGPDNIWESPQQQQQQQQKRKRAQFTVSLLTVNSALGVALVCATAAVCVGFSVDTTQSLLDTSEQTGRTGVEDCFSSANVAIAQLTTSTLRLMMIDAGYRVESFLDEVFAALPRSIMHSITIAGADKAASWDWIDSELRGIIGGQVYAHKGEVTACGYFAGDNTLVLYETPETVRNSRDEPHTYLIIQGNASGGLVGVDDGKAGIANAVPYEIDLIPPRGRQAYLDQRAGISDIEAITGYVGMWSTVRFTISSPTATTSGVALCGMDLRGLSSFFAAVAVTRNGSVVYAVEHTGHLLAVSDNSSVGLLDNATGVLHPHKAADAETELIAASWRFLSQSAFSIPPGGYYETEWTLTNATTGVAVDYFLLEHRTEAELVNWTIVVTLERSVVYGEIDRVQTETRAQISRDFAAAEDEKNRRFGQMYVVLGACALFFVFLSAMFARRVAAPVRLLRDDMLEVAHMHLDGLRQERTSWISELAAMHSAFQKMVHNLVEYRKFLPRDVLDDDNDVDNDEEDGSTTPSLGRCNVDAAGSCRSTAYGSLQGSPLQGFLAPDVPQTSLLMPARTDTSGGERGSRDDRVSVTRQMTSDTGGLGGAACRAASVSSAASERDGETSPRTLLAVAPSGNLHNPISPRRGRLSESATGSVLALRRGNSAGTARTAKTHKSGQSRRTLRFVTDGDDGGDHKIRRLQETSLRVKKASLACVMSEPISPDAAASTCARVVDTIKQNDGLWLGVTGNVVTAVWNAFISSTPQHACLAAGFALDVLRYGDGSGLWSAASNGAVRYGYVSGTAGDHKKHFITGTPVNITSDMLPLAKVLYVPSVCDHVTHELITWKIRGRVVDCYMRDATGKATGRVEEAKGTVSMYELRGRKSNVLEVSNGSGLLTPAGCSVREWNEAFSCFLHHKWTEAQCRFEAILLGTGADDFQAFRLMRLAVLFAANEEAGVAALPKPYCRFRSRCAGWEDWETLSVELPLPDGMPVVEPRGLPVDVRGGMAARRSSAAEHEALLRAEIENFRQTEEKAERKEPISPQQRVQTSLTYSPTTSTGHLQDKAPAPAGNRGVRIRDRRGHVWIRSDKMLGQGAFGEVWLGMGQDGQLVAMKCLKLQAMEPAVEMSGHRQRRGRHSPAARKEALERQVDELVQEVGLLAKLRHENIVSYLSSVFHKGAVWICTEYLPGGTLIDVVDHFGAIAEPQLKRYMRDTIEGLKYLHTEGVIHRDIKPHNVLLQIDGVAKLTDFGASFLVATASGKNTGPIGTPFYMSPEACSGKAGAPADIWAIGIMFVQLATGALPWNLPQPFIPQAFLYRLSNEEDLMPDIPSSLSAGARGFVDCCLHRDPEVRATARGLLAHAFLM